MRPVLLITGASSGIGAACALRAAPDYDLVLTYANDRDGGETTAARAREAGAEVLLCRYDALQEGAETDLFGQIDSRFGRLDALINNAGVVDAKAQVTEFDHARLTRMFGINVFGPMLVAKEAVLRMRSGGRGGAIVNISSAAARLGAGGQFVDYAASKAAIDTFTKGLSDEVAPEGIRVVSLRPGLIETAIHAKGGEPDRLERLSGTVPMRRAGSPDEIAKTALWLISDGASYVTGCVIDVTGGR